MCSRRRRCCCEAVEDDGSARRGRRSASASPQGPDPGDHRRIGTAGGTGHVIEYRGDTFEAMSVEGRLTVANMSIEAGARSA
jgi:hypothetical protein